MADTTFFGSVSGIGIDNPTAFSYSFIFNKALELPESPLMHPFVISCSSSDIAQIFHHNSASIGDTINDSLAYIMVSPCHKLSPSSRDFFQMPLGRFSAFGLEFANQFIMLNPELFDFPSEKELIGCDCQVIYSDINSKNLILEVRVTGIDIFRECEQEEAPAFFINPQKALFYFPSEIFNITIGNRERNFNPSFNCGKAQDIILEGSRTREVISHTNIADDWLGFSLLDHSTALFDTSDSKLRWHCLSEMFVNERMESDIIPYLISPSSIDAVLQSFTIDFESFDYLGCCIDFYFSCCSDFHIGSVGSLIFKSWGGGIPLHPNCFAVRDVVSCQR